ncbi:MAG: VCBS domain-containing protein [Oceanisphaera sp.]
MDNQPPNLVGELKPQEDADADDISLDISKEFNDAISGSDLTYQANNLPTGLEIDPKTGIISGKIDSSASQGGNTDTQGDYKVTITVTDPAGNSSDHDFVWTVTNPDPTASDDKGATDEDTSLVVEAKDGVLKNDNDPDGDELFVTGIVAGGDKPTGPGGLDTEITGKYGTLTLQEDGSYVYTPNKDNPEVRALKDGEVLEDTFSYTMTDREGGEDDAVLKITINGVTDSEPTITPEDHNNPDDPTDPLTAGHATVYESGLVAGGSAGQSKTATGEITVDAKDGLISVTVGAETLDLDALTALSSTTPVTITTDYGVLTLIGFTPEVVNGITVGGELNYSYELKKPFDNAEPGQAGDENGLDKIDLKVVDAGKTESSGTLDINIIDDVPVANDDVNSITEDTTVSATGNVFGSESASVGDVEDTQGADGATVTGVQAGEVIAGSHVADGNLATQITGKYGTLTLNADGTYSYELDNTNLTVQGLGKDETLKDEVFSYTITDKDGDQSTASLTITINGQNDEVTVDVPIDHTVPLGPDGKPTNPADYAKTDDHVVFESGLVGGSNQDADATKVVSNFTLKALDGLDPTNAFSITYKDENGVEQMFTLGKDAIEALDTTPQTITTQYGELKLNGYSQAADGTITISYDYELKNAPTVTGDATNDDFAITVKDKDVDSAAGTISIKIIDDAPVAVDDANSITEDEVSVAGNVMGGTGAATGDVADTQGADDADVSGITSINAPTHVAIDTAGVLEIEGQYGTLTINHDGSYSYVLDNSNLAVQGLIVGEDLTETFNYIITDGDGDSSSADLVITIKGANDGVAVTVPDPTNPADPNYPEEDPDNSDKPTWGGIDDQVVFESGLVGGSQNSSDTDAVDDLVMVDYSFTLSALDGLDDDQAITFAVVGEADITLSKADVEALNTTSQTITTEHGELVLNGYTLNADGTITIDYEYTLTDAPENSDAGVFTDDTIKITVNDRDTDSDEQDLIIRIMDDVPVAEPDEESVDEGALLTVNATDGVLSNDKSGADGWANAGNAVVGVVAGTGGGAVENGNVGNSIAGTYGTLTLNADGSYSYQASPDATTQDVQDVFTYTVKDADGDLVETTLTINVQDVTVAPTPATGEVKESGLTGGTTEGSDHTTTGSLNLPAGQTAKAKTGDATHGTFEVNADGTYTYTLTDKTVGDDVEDSFTYTSTDTNGNTVENTVTITIVDDEPIAKDDTDTVAAGDYTAEEGNVITGEGTNEGAGGTGADSEGADGASLTKVQFGTNEVQVPATGQATIEGDYGTLIIDADGSYGYTRNPNTPGGVSDVFTYTLTDGDDDEATATLTIDIENSTPEITDLTLAVDGGELTVDEQYLPDGRNPDSAQLTKTGDFKITSGDGVKSLTVTGKDGNHITVIENGAMTGTLEIDTPSGTLLITGYDPDTGVVEYSYTLTGNEDHVKPDNDTELFEDISLVLTDHDDQTASGALSVKIIDDEPSIELGTGQVGSLVVDETNFVGGEVSATDADFVKDVFDITMGADTDGATTTYSLEVADETGTASDLIDTATGEPILLYQDGTGVVGRVKNENGAEAFKIEIDANGSVTLTQSRALQHLDPDTTEETVSITNEAIKLHATAVDGDGDTVKTAGVDVGSKFTFRDDGPTLKDGQVDQDGFVIGNETVDEKHLSSGSDPTPGELTVTKELPIDFGADGAVNAAGDTGLVFANTTELEALNLKSGTTDLTYAISDDGHTITAKAGSKDIFTIKLKVATDGTPSYEFTLQGPLDHTLNDDGETAKNIVLPFDIAATDGDGDSVDLKFKVGVIDDTPEVDRKLDVNEDDSVSFSNADINQTTTTVKTAPEHGTVTIGNDGTITYVPNEDYRGSDSYTYTVTTDSGTYDRTVNITVNPVADKPLFADGDGKYPDELADGEVGKDGSVEQGTYDYSVQTNEDEAVGLELHVPKVKDDATDPNNNDTSELLGAITLEFKDLATDYTPELQLADGTVLSSDTNGKFQFVIVDNDNKPLNWHLDIGLPDEDTDNGVHYLTEEQYKGLKVDPPAERHENFKVEVSVDSYEVDEQGAKLADVDGATSTQVIDVGVQAVTDPVDLKIKDAGDQFADGDENNPIAVLMEEDKPFDLATLLQITLDKESDDNTTADIDGSEERWFTVTGLPEGSDVNGHIITAEESTNGYRVDIPNSYNGANPTMPVINVTAPKDFSGDIEGVEIKLHAQDRDDDGVGEGPTTGAELTDSVYVDLHVNPIAGDVNENSAHTIDEDNPVAFLSSITVTDKSSDAATGGEVMTKVEFTLPTDANSAWTLNKQPASTDMASDGWTITGSDSGPYTIEFNDDSSGGNKVLTQEERENLLKEFEATPPAHRSLDAKDWVIEVTTQDSQTVDSNVIVSGEVKTDHKVTITVKPVAEKVADSNDPSYDTDDDGEADLTMTKGHSYKTAGEEDAWFELNQDGFNLKADWTNQDGKDAANGGTDGSEETFALLTPELIAGDGSQASANGAKFVWGDTGQFSATFGGDPIEVPIEFLDTLQFKAPENFAGMFKVKVQAKTVDYDEDHPGDLSKADIAVSGEAWLENVLIAPKADTSTTSLTARVEGNEDEAMPLSIRPKSSDPAEVFDVTVSNIPKGATLTYGATAIKDGKFYEFTLVDDVIVLGDELSSAPEGLTPSKSGSTFGITFENFQAEDMTVTAPLDSNEDFELTVSTQTVDKLKLPSGVDPDDFDLPAGVVKNHNSDGTYTLISKSDAEDLTIDVAPKGVADPAEFELSTNLEYTEAQAESSGINVSDLIAKAELKDDDGSEALTFKLGNLPAGFEVEGATLIGGTGADREWSFNEATINNIIIKAPANYNGIVDFKIYTITTENDGDSLTEDHDVQLTITPTPEATMNLSASIDEDVSTALDFSVIHQNGDTDESISKVWIKVDSVKDGLTLTLGDGGPALSTTENMGGDDYYVVEQGNLGNIYAQGATNWHGTTDFDVKYEVTDPGSDGLTDVTDVFDGNYTVEVAAITDQVTLGITSGADTTLSEGGTVNVALTVGNDDGNGSHDSDGSEMLTRIIVEDVPAGVIITNPGSHLVGDGVWVLEIDQAMYGALAPQLSFDVHGSTINGEHDIKVTVVSEDAGNGTEATATETIRITTAFAGPGAGEDPAVIVTWEQTTFEPTEDTGFTLDEAINAEIDDTGVASNSFTVTLKDLPTGTTVDGMTRTVVNGEEIWSATGQGGAAELQTLLEGITVTAPADFNSNQGQFEYTATLTTHVPSGGREKADAAMEQTVIPVTDDAEIVITAPAVDEGNSLAFNIDISNPADNPAWAIVDDKLYLQVESTIDGKLYDSTGNTELSATAVSGVEGVDNGNYYVIELGESTSTDVVFKPTEPHAKGDVTINAWVQNKEENATNIATGNGTGTTAIQPVNSGYEFEITSSAGTENPSSNKAVDGGNLIEIEVGGTGLNDTTTEKVDTILLGNLPNGFLVYVGKDAASATKAEMANNAGGEGTNTWLLGDKMPNYIGILPPKNWSGTIEGIEFTVISGEPSLTDKDTTTKEFDLTATPVADGVTLDPTASFGNEGEIIGLNLNANLKDLNKAGDTDQHVELITLEISGIGEHAGFYVGDTLISGTERVVENENGTYTIKGLSQDDVDNLGFIQANKAIKDAGGIKVKAQSQEYDLDENSKPDLTKPVVADGATSEWTTDKPITTNIVDQYATTDDDTLLWGGEFIDGRGGEDTVQLRFGDNLDTEDFSKLENIEIIDMRGAASGANQISGLGMQDVLDMTDENNVLKILGDAGKVTLDGSWAKGATDAGGLVTYTNGDAKLEIADTIIID